MAVHLFSAKVTHAGGVVIDVAALDRSDWSAWSWYWGVDVRWVDSGGDELVVYKAVDDDLRSGRGFAYPIGETVECLDWRDDGECGHGLHLSPRPYQARSYFTRATRFLECAVRVRDLRIIDGNGQATPKLKARVVRVLREVDIDGQPVNA